MPAKPRTSHDFRRRITISLASISIENSKTVVLYGKSFPVLKTFKIRLRQITFQFEGHTIRGIEQNPVTKSRGAALAKLGQKVMQFVENGSYIAVVADGKLHSYRQR
jgi:hypothetical protein